MLKRSGLRVFAGLLTFAMLAASQTAEAQRKKTKPDASQAATVSQTIGVDSKVEISYHRPSVKGRNVWTDSSDNPVIGRLVPHNEDPRPWRAGANEATTITFSDDVEIEGQDLAAGTYALFMVPTDGDWTVIFNKNAKQWGSFQYNKEEDALRVTVKPVEAPHQEQLVFGFDEVSDNGCTAYLHWEKKKVPFKIELEEQG